MADTALPDFLFHWDGGGTEWEHLRVVSFRIADTMSTPFEAKLVVHARGPENEVDPETLVGQLGTLRVNTASSPAARAVHGLIAEASEIGATSSGMLYELILVPPVVRAMHRVKSRIFLERTTKEIIETVLSGDPKMTANDPSFEAPSSVSDAFQVPKEHFAFRLQDPSRIEDKATRPYCVQYNESDFDFVSRLLTEEGIAYHFEHHAGAIVLVMSDADTGRTKLDPFDALAPNVLGRIVDTIRLGKRLRPTKFRLTDYNWQKPSLDMKVEAKGDGDESLAVEVYPGLYPDEPKQGELLAKARLERLATESRYAEVATPCRLLGAGNVFQVSHQTSRYEGEYLVSKAILVGYVRGELPPGEALPIDPLLRGERPFYAQLECVRRGSGSSTDESKFRPAVLPKPRIIGSQTAIVTAEPSTKGAEIHVGGPEGNENGCVRLKFHWDLETDRHDKEPTSNWVRVSQAFAGAGGGALCHPRVGTEVIVEFIDGDPDRPIVVGRVYNGQQPSPALGKGAATVTTLKSLSSPGGKVFNEFQFDDTAGKEKVNLNAGKDWNSTVGNDRNETVSNNSNSTVQANRKEDTTSNRTTSVGGDNSESVSGNETVSVSGNQSISVGGDQKQSVGGNETTGIGGNRGLSVGGAQTISVSGANSVAIGGAETCLVSAAQNVTIGAAKTDTIAADYTIGVGAGMAINVSAAYGLKAGASIANQAPVIANKCTTFGVEAGGVALIQAPVISALADGVNTIQGATVMVTGSGAVIISGGAISIKGSSISLEAGTVKIAGGSVDITGGTVSVN